MLLSLPILPKFPTTICSLSPPSPTTAKTPHHRRHRHRNFSPPPHQLLQFRISHRAKLRYLQTLGIPIPEPTKSQTSPNPPQTLTHILSTINLLKSKGFNDPDFPRLATLCPNLFSSSTLSLPHSQIQSVFHFLNVDVSASPDQSRGIILRCPQILNSDVVSRLRPTVLYLRELGLEKLNTPSSLNAHLLNKPVDRLEENVGFLRSVGLTREESASVCSRFPAIFGYCVEENLRVKFEYLVREMERDGVMEVIGFPQYFGFSFEERIVPRHLYLKERNVVVRLRRMLVCGDDKFYASY